MYVSIDIETLGLDPDVCDVIEFGAVFDNLKDPIEKLPSYHAYILPPCCNSPTYYYRGEPIAMAMHATILNRIAKREAGFTYLPPDMLGPDFSDWLVEQGYLRAHACAPVNIVVAGKNFANFDLRFLRRLDEFEDRIKICRQILDPATLYHDPRIDITPPGLSTCLERAGFSATVQHTAVEDAIDVIRCLRHKWKNIFELDL